MSFSKGPEKRPDGHASLHTASAFVCGLVVEALKRFSA